MHTNRPGRLGLVDPLPHRGLARTDPTPLHDAVLRGDVRALRSLLSDGCDPNALRVVEYVGDVSPGREFALDVAECTPLMLAAAIGYPACVRELLPVSNVGARNGAADSALTFAARAGHALCIRFLLMGAGAQEASCDRETALVEAARRGRLEALGLLLPHSRAAAIDLAFMEAVRAQNPRVVLTLLPGVRRAAIEAALAETTPARRVGPSLGDERSRDVRELARERIARLLQSRSIDSVETLDRRLPTVGADA